MAVLNTMGFTFHFEMIFMLKLISHLSWFQIIILLHVTLRALKYRQGRERGSWLLFFTLDFWGFLVLFGEFFLKREKYKNWESIIPHSFKATREIVRERESLYLLFEAFFVLFFMFCEDWDNKKKVILLYIILD